MNIIEKLGIEVIEPHVVDETYGGYNTDEYNDLRNQRDEMLTALIAELKNHENNGLEGYEWNSLSKMIIEESCFPKKWEEIKALLNDNN